MKFRGIALGGLAVAAALSVSTAAMAQCVGTGLGGVPVAAAALSPFASGGAVNTLVSSINAASTAFLTQSSAFVSAPGNPKPNQEGGGVWARGIGGESNTKNTGVSTYALSGVGAIPGNITCDTKTNLKYAGYQAGTDIARLNINGLNIHVGATVGYLGAKASDRTTPDAIINTNGGTLVDTLQIPFVGMYAAATYGGFFVDGQLRWDYIQNRLNDPINGIFNQNLDARSFAFTGNLGYNVQLQNNWFIEPSAGIVVSKTKVDPFNFAGSFVNANGLAVPGTIAIHDINSTLGRLSVRGGVTIPTQTVVWQPFATASVYHEFGGNVTTDFTSNFAAAGLGFPSLTGTLSTSNLGTYGQFALGVAAQVVNTGWLGYLRGDYRTGDHIEGYSINGGLRYQFTPTLFASPVIGKVKAPPMPMVTAFNWTGFYVGGSVGVLAGWTDWTISPFGTTTDPRFAGFLGNVQAGYDYQTGKWVVGLEGTIGPSNAHGSRACPNGFFFNCETKTDWYGTVTGKVGYAFAERSVAYVRGGLAVARSTQTANCNASPVFTIVPGCVSASASRTNAGWTAGVGSEFALNDHWTVRSETNYFDLGKATYTISTSPTDVKETGVVSTVGVNYRFNGGDVVAVRAKY